MSLLSENLEEILAPTRDLYLSRYFRRLAKWRKIGYDVEPEPKIRTMNGAVLRDGVLNLPRRADFGLNGTNGPEYRDVPEICDLVFEPMEFSLSRSATISVHPFCWKSFSVTFDADEDPQRLHLVRQWYLESFQHRRMDEGPDVLGVLHSLNGPTLTDDSWVIDVDMGSAPIADFSRLLDHLVSSGVRNISVGTDVQSTFASAS